MVDLEEMERRVVAPEKTEKVLVVTVDPAAGERCLRRGRSSKKRNFL